MDQKQMDPEQINHTQINHTQMDQPLHLAAHPCSPAKNAAFRIVTLGCKVNEYESRYYQEQLEKAGLISLDEHAERAGESADVVLINTCTVTNTAASKSRKMVHRAKRQNPNAKIVVVGCYVQTEEKQILETLQADLLVGAKGKAALAQKITALLNNDSKTHEDASLPTKPDGHDEEMDAAVQNQAEGFKVLNGREDRFDFEAMPIEHFFGQHRAFLKIQDGCNQFCSYCQIPLARGRERNAEMSQILTTAAKLALQGHLEIVLTGIHTGRYKDPKTGADLTELLKKLLEQTPEDVCFRISSIEITEVSDALIDLMKDHPRILPHLHIPIQSGSDATLARMKRPYTSRQFIERLKYIRQMLPDAAISTDVIAGFVQESPEEFEQTLETLKECAFSFLHVFPYSRRKGTAADSMQGFVNGDTIKERVGVLLDLSDQMRRQHMETLLGKTLQVLVEREDPRQPGVYLGYCKEYQPVSIISSKPLSRRVSVRPKYIQNLALWAETGDELE